MNVEAAVRHPTKNKRSPPAYVRHRTNVEADGINAKFIVRMSEIKVIGTAYSRKLTVRAPFAGGAFFMARAFLVAGAEAAIVAVRLELRVERAAGFLLSGDGDDSSRVSKEGRRA